MGNQRWTRRAETARQLNTEIRKLVLSTIAGLDLKGDLRIAAALPNRPLPVKAMRGPAR